MVTSTTDRLWDLALNRQQIDPVELAEAVQEEASRNELDFRTRLLIRDSLEALRLYWGGERLESWLTACPARPRMETILREDLGEAGFPSLPRRIVETTKPDTIRQFFRELGVHLSHPQRVDVGGSAALILQDHLSRRTEDVDVVDEVPAGLRAHHRLLEDLHERYNLELTHFQSHSHYLPSGWEGRLHSLGAFGRLEVHLVDVYDIFLGKLFSKREKDRDDLRVLAPRLDRETLARRLRETTTSLRADAGLRAQAETNWYILYGESLPS